YTGVLTASIQADGARLRPVASDHAVALEGAEVVRRKPEQLAVDVRVVLAEPRRTVADRAGRARETRIDALHAHGTDDRVVHGHEIFARGDVRVGEDVGRRVRDAERHLVPLEDVGDLRRRP